MIGILALHGGFAEHSEILDELELAWKLVKGMQDVEGLNGLIIPGGESTVMKMFLAEYGMQDWLRSFEGVIYGTCAGLILLADLEILNVKVERNAYGRQLESFVAELEISGVGPVHGHFIRAPKIVSVGEGVEVLAEHEGVPVCIRHGKVWASSFHPELAGDSSLHGVIF